LNGLLSQTQRSRHRMARIIEDRSLAPACGCLVLSFLFYSLAVSLFLSSLSSFLTSYVSPEVRAQFMVLVNSYEQPTKRGSVFTASPMASIRICDCVLTPLLKTFAFLLYKPKPMVKVRAHFTMIFILLI